METKSGGTLALRLISLHNSLYILNINYLYTHEAFLREPFIIRIEICNTNTNFVAHEIGIALW